MTKKPNSFPLQNITNQAETGKHRHINIENSRRFSAAGNEDQKHHKTCKTEREDADQRENSTEARQQTHRRTKKRANLTDNEEELLKIHNYSEKHNLLSMHKYKQKIMEYYNTLDGTFDCSEISIPLEMRSLLVDWLISVCERLSISDDALYLSVHLIDRFLVNSSISSNKIQLVGVTALLIAAKYEEVLCPDIASFIMLIDQVYTDEDIKRAEKYMLHVLGYKIEYVNPLIFLRRASKANNYEAESRKMGKYFLEVMLVYPQFLQFSKNVVSTTAMYLSRKICGCDVNKNLFNLYTSADKGEMRKCLNEITRIIYQEIKYENVENKYAKASMYCVSVKARKYAQENFN